MFADASKTATQQLPFAFQRSLLAQNEFALDLAANKQGSISSAARAGQKTGLSGAWVGVFDAAAHARNRTGKEAIQDLLPILERRPYDVGLVLTIVQLYVMTNNTQTAISLLEGVLRRLEETGSASDADTRFAPGLVGAMAALYADQNRTVPAKTELAKAARYWRRRNAGAEGGRSLLYAAGAALAESHLEEEVSFAHELFTDAAGGAIDDVVKTAGLVASQASADRIDARSLPSVAELVQSVDVEALESGGISRPAAKASAGVGTKRTSTSTSKASKSKKVRKSRMPKDYDAAKKPDPERWLPLRDRSNWRPKGKKKNKSQGGGTQGGVVEEATATKNVSPGTVQSAASNKSKKKKGKGK